MHLDAKIGGVYFKSARAWTINKFSAIATTQNISFMNSPLFSQSDILMKFSEAKHVPGCCDMGPDKTRQMNSAFVRARHSFIPMFQTPPSPSRFCTRYSVQIYHQWESNFCANLSRGWRLRQVLMRRAIVGNYENAPVFWSSAIRAVEFGVEALVRSGGDERALMDCD